MPRLLLLLKEVKLLLRFLNGDHGLDILSGLQQHERALRGFVTDDVKSWLCEMDRRHANLQTDRQRGKERLFMTLFLVYCVYGFAKKFDNPEYPNYPSEFANMIIISISIPLLAYGVISTYFILGQSPAQRQSSNSNNSLADEVVTEGLLSYLLSRIRNEVFRRWSSNIVFEKIKIILESLETGFYSSRQQQSSESSTGGAHNFSQPPIDLPRLLRLLKDVELLLKFLNGDHGLDILYRLQQREYALRGFVTDAVKSQLYETEWPHLITDLQRWKVTYFMIPYLVFCVIVFAEKFDDPEYPNSPSEFADMIIFAIFILLIAYYLAMQISTYFRLGQSHAQRQSSNSNNSCCGGFQLKILAAVVVAYVAIVMAVPGSLPSIVLNLSLYLIIEYIDVSLQFSFELIMQLGIFFIFFVALHQSRPQAQRMFAFG